jgi:hypothetical protein
VCCHNQTEKQKFQMNWKNVCRICWCGIVHGDKHRVEYNGSKLLPGSFVGNGVIDLTAQEFRSMYLILKAEELKGMPVAWSGDEITATVPRTVIGLDKVEDYFKEQAAKTKAAVDYDDKLKIQERMKELERRVTVLEGYLKEVCDISDSNERLFFWQEYEEEEEAAGVDPNPNHEEEGELAKVQRVGRTTQRHCL